MARKKKKRGTFGVPNRILWYTGTEFSKTPKSGTVPGKLGQMGFPLFCSTCPK
jgi:hypothetical protein